MILSSNHLLVAGFMAFTAGTGIAGLTGTDLRAGAPVLGGQYQRVVEADFAESLPQHAPSAALATAMGLVVFGQAHPEVVIGTDDWLFTAEEFRAPADAPDLGAALGQAQAALAPHGITLIPVIVPDKARIEGHRLRRPRAPGLEGRYDAALRLLSDRGLPAIDLRGPLAGGFLRTDTHWSPEGAARAAQAIATHLPQGGTRFTTQTQTPQPFTGDLMRFVETGALAPWVGIAPEVLSTPQTQAEAAGLLGAAEIGLVLVGTSFSARSEFNFAGALSQATGHDLVNLAAEGRGPFEPMRAALADASIPQIGPRAVIWEIPERYLNPRSF